MTRLNDKIKKSGGFTLLELMVSLLIMSVLLAAASSVFFIAMKMYTRGENISYKSGSITNIETKLQNGLSIASATGVKIDTVAGGDYSIGFKDGVCMEVINGVEYEIDQISEMKFTVINVNTMAYEITPKDDSMAKLTGGIVMNNIKVSPFSSEVLSGGNKFLVITYETGS
ncbi:type II secretion system protein J [Acetobacterium sp.]|uniref:PulJ/GspJ family protein n=1 Tax=Acetobacterium sp. TaxID=1872094 RepID=UPI003593DEA1